MIHSGAMREPFPEAGAQPVPANTNRSLVHAELTSYFLGPESVQPHSNQTSIHVVELVQQVVYLIIGLCHMGRIGLPAIQGGQYRGRLLFTGRAGLQALLPLGPPPVLGGLAPDHRQSHAEQLIGTAKVKLLVAEAANQAAMDRLHQVHGVEIGTRAGPSSTRATIRTSGSYISTSFAKAFGSPWRARTTRLANSSRAADIACRPTSSTEVRAGYAVSVTAPGSGSKQEVDP